MLFFSLFKRLFCVIRYFFDQVFFLVVWETFCPAEYTSHMLCTYPTTLHCTALHCTALYCDEFHRSALRLAELHCVATAVHRSSAADAAASLTICSSGAGLTIPCLMAAGPGSVTLRVTSSAAPRSARPGQATASQN